MKFENQYLKHNEYKELGGNLSEMPFNLLEYRAEKLIDEMTSNRFRKTNLYPIELKLCVNELMSELKKYNETSNKSSESIGNYSVNYDKPITNEKKKYLKSIIKEYLSNTKIDSTYVLYCGSDENDN